MQTPRALLGALALTLALAGCDAAAPDSQAVAGPPDAFAAVLDAEMAEATADRLPDARAVAERAGLRVRFITEPTTITESGVYIVTADFSAAADGITVQADRVLLDLGGHTLTGPDHKVGRGVYADGVDRLLLIGGTLSTFGTGVALEDATKSAVFGVRVEGGDEFADPPNGVPPQVGFLLLNSAQVRLFGNTAHLTNLGFFVRGPGSMGNRLFGNTATGGTNALLGICYNPAPNTPDPAGPSGDRVTGNYLDGFNVGIQVSEGSAGNDFRQNVIYYRVAPWEDANGTNTFRQNETMQITV